MKKTAMKQNTAKNKKKVARPIAPDMAIKAKFAQEQSHSNFTPSRHEVSNSPHRMSKAEKSERKK